MLFRSDKAMVGMAAEPTPAVRASLSVQEMRHCLIDAIYSSKDIDKLHTCLVILNSKSNKHKKSPKVIKAVSKWL